jgi:hypothetical protein
MVYVTPPAVDSVIEAVPLNGFVPVHELLPLAVHDSASVADHVRVVGSPTVRLVGFAVSVTAGSVCVIWIAALAWSDPSVHETL